MNEMPTSSIKKELRACRKATRCLCKVIQKMRKEDKYTVDVEQRLLSTYELLTRLHEDVFSLSARIRISSNKISQRILNSTNEIIGASKDFGLRFYNYDLEKAMNYEDSKYIQKKDNDRFSKEAIKISLIRINLFQICETRNYLEVLSERYGVHEYLLSDRGIKWVQVLIGFGAGVITTVLTILLPILLNSNNT